MDINEYISSGILELYVAGALATDENHEVEVMARRHREARDEIEAIEAALIALTSAPGTVPRSEVRVAVLDRVEQLENAAGRDGIIGSLRNRPIANGLSNESRAIGERVSMELPINGRASHQEDATSAIRSRVEASTSGVTNHSTGEATDSTEEATGSTEEATGSTEEAMGSTEEAMESTQRLTSPTGKATSSTGEVPRSTNAKRVDENPQRADQDQIHKRSPATIIALQPRARYLIAASIAIALISSAAATYFAYQWNVAERELTLVTNENLRVVQEQSVLETRLGRSQADLAVLMQSENRVVRMKGLPIAPKTIATVYWNPRTRDLHFDRGSLPPLPRGKQYQLWAIADGTPVDAGMIRRDGDGEGLQQMKSIAMADAFAVTLESEGGSTAPTLDAMYVIGTLAGESS